MRQLTVPGITGFWYTGVVRHQSSLSQVLVQQSGFLSVVGTPVSFSCGSPEWFLVVQWYNTVVHYSDFQSAVGTLESYTRVGTLEFVHQSSGSSSQVLQQQQRINCLLPPLSLPVTSSKARSLSDSPSSNGEFQRSSSRRWWSRFRSSDKSEFEIV